MQLKAKCSNSLGKNNKDTKVAKCLLKYKVAKLLLKAECNK